ncbi:MAG: hypothetical protein VCA73_09835 [Roseibacillus sp.]
MTLGAASPGEVKNGGLGLTIRYGFGPTPFGECLLAQTVRGICALSFVDPAQCRLAEERLQAEWPGARLSRSDPAAHTVLQEILTAQLTALRPLRAFVKGSKFQIRVWRVRLRIPPAPQSATVASPPRSEIPRPPARWEQR